MGEKSDNSLSLALEIPQEELMKSCQVYQEIAYSQLSKEELSHE